MLSSKEHDPKRSSVGVLRHDKFSAFHVNSVHYSMQTCKHVITVTCFLVVQHKDIDFFETPHLKSSNRSELCGTPPGVWCGAVLRSQVFWLVKRRMQDEFTH